MRFFLALASLLAIQLLPAQEIAIVPTPASMTLGKGHFTINPSTPIVLEGSGLEKSVNFLNDYLFQFYGFKLPVLKTAKSGKSIVLNYERMDNPLPGAYRLEVKQDQIYIAGDNEEGVFYAIQSLIQLLPVEPSRSLFIPSVAIEDRPRFGYRGLHLDVGRHFFSVGFIKKYIDYIALHKMNYFHWHLTEDQGWRIEIKKYPLLTVVGSCRNGTVIGRNTGKYDSVKYCGYYTQEQVKDIVKYASDRYITIIPEIEMPGHAMAAMTAYPYLGCTGGPYEVQQRWGVFREVFCAGNDSTFQFLQDVLDEVIELFPSKYIHIGGDECPKDRWKTCPKCQRRMKENNLQNEHELQSYFIRRIENYLSTKGRSIIGWDEILEGGLAPKATVMSWRGEQGGIDAAKQNHDVVMTPSASVYLNYAQKKNEDSLTIGGYLPLEKVYGYEPVPASLSEVEAKHILGAQANIWSEYTANNSILEYMMFPRLSALSEVLWSPKAKRDWKDFSKRLPTQFKRYELWKAHYSRAYYDIKASILPADDGKGLLWKLESNTSVRESKILYSIYDTSGKRISYPDAPKKKEDFPPISVCCSATYVAHLFLGDFSDDTKSHETKEVSMIRQKFFINKATGKKITLASPPLDNLPGNGGAFGLVNGAISDRGINSIEWLGWQDADMEASIDLGAMNSIASVNIHLFEQTAGRFHKPSYMEVLISDDGNQFHSIGKTDSWLADKDNMGNMTIEFPTVQARYIKVVAKNPGVIPEGQPYAGSRARILIDEIQVF